MALAKRRANDNFMMGSQSRCEAMCTVVRNEIGLNKRRNPIILVERGKEIIDLMDFTNIF